MSPRTQASPPGRKRGSWSLRPVVVTVPEKQVGESTVTLVPKGAVICMVPFVVPHIDIMRRTLSVVLVAVCFQQSTNHDVAVSCCDGVFRVILVLQVQPQVGAAELVRACVRRNSRRPHSSSPSLSLGSKLVADVELVVKVFARAILWRRHLAQRLPQKAATHEKVSRCVVRVRRKLVGG